MFFCRSACPVILEIDLSLLHQDIVRGEATVLISIYNNAAALLYMYFGSIHVN